MVRVRCRNGVVAACLAMAGCGDPPVLTVDLVLGHETDALSRDPAVVRVDVVVRSVTDSFEASASAAPGGTFDLGEIAADQLLELEATGVTADGTPVVRGRSLSGIGLFDSEGGGALPLFVQRIDGLARPPGGLARAHSGAPAIGFAERYVLSAGGEAETDGDPALADAYDLLFFAGAPSAAALPRTPESMLSRGTAVLCIDATGATWVDLATSESADLDPPAGLGSFDDVAGGQVVEAPDGISFVVGAARDAARGPTSAVLRIDAAGALAALSLSTPRAGAAAAWVPDVGLVVAGGSADAAGGEVLGQGGTAFAEIPFPPDSTTGAAIVVTGEPDVLLVGGSAPDGEPVAGRLFDPRCASECVAEAVAELGLGAASARAAAYATGSGRAVVVIETAGDVAETLAFEIDAAGKSTRQLILREPRRGATAVPAPNGTLALLGGQHLDGTPARAIEVFWVER